MGTRLMKRLGYGHVDVPDGLLNDVPVDEGLDGFFRFVELEYPDSFWWLEQVTEAKTVGDVFRMVRNGDEFDMGDGRNVMVVTPPNLVQECYSFDSSFSYAELERFAPDCLKDMSGFAYTVNTPIFPTEYEVVFVEDRFQKLQGSAEREVYRFLREVQDGLVVDEHYTGITGVVAAKMNGCASPLEVLQKYRLAPPVLVQAFCDYFHVFKEPDFVVELKPTVLYYWS